MAWTDDWTKGPDQLVVTSLNSGEVGYLDIPDTIALNDNSKHIQINSQRGFFTAASFNIDDAVPNVAKVKLKQFIGPSETANSVEIYEIGYWTGTGFPADWILFRGEYFFTVSAFDFSPKNGKIRIAVF